MVEQSYDLLLKVLLIGQEGTGKSCLLMNFTGEQFSEAYISTIGVDFKVKSL